MAIVMNPVVYDEVEKWKRFYQQAKPFPHVVIDNFLDEALALSCLQDFPDTSKMHSSRVYMFGNKYELASMEKISSVFHSLRDELLSERFTQFMGICLRRDNWVSVRYAEELNSAKSSVTLQRTDRHGILDQKHTDFQVSL